MKIKYMNNQIEIPMLKKIGSDLYFIMKNNIFEIILIYKYLKA